MNLQDFTKAVRTICKQQKFEHEKFYVQFMQWSDEKIKVHIAFYFEDKDKHLYISQPTTQDALISLRAEIDRMQLVRFEDNFNLKEV